MNKKLMYGALAALLFPLASCQDEVDGVRSGMVDYTVSAGLPTAIGTYGSSNKGGVNNVDANAYDLKYTLEVWDGDKVVYTDNKTVGDNFASSNVNFKMRLAAKPYKFVFFAEFVNQKTNESYYDLSNGLDDIRLKTRVYGDDAVDAYYANETIDLSQESVAKSVTLKRKFGKIRLLATDELDGTGATPASAVITYNQAEVPSAFNAVTGEVSGSITNYDFTYTVPVEKETFQEKEAYVVGFDYILPSNASNAYSFNIKILDEAGQPIGSREVSNIPVAENKLTTVYGNFYSNEGDLTVSVDDAFLPGDDIETSKPIVVSPDKDLAKIIADAPAGATIQLTEGKYLCPNGLLLSKAVRLIGAPDHKSVITVSNTSSVKYGIALKGNVEGTVIDGLTVYSGVHSTQENASIMIYSGGTENSPVTIKNCKLLETSNSNAALVFNGITGTGDDIQYLQVLNNEVINSRYGMFFNRISESLIANNTITNTLNGGIIIGADNSTRICKNVEVNSNTLTGISSAGKESVYVYALAVAGAYGENITENGNTVVYAQSAHSEIAKINAYGFDVTGTNLSDMINSAADGATIRLAAGTSYSGATIPAGKHITIIGADDMTSKINGQLTTTGASVTVKNVVFEGTSYGIYADSGASIDAENCVFNVTPNTYNNNTAVMTWANRGINPKVYLTNCVFNAEGVRTVQLRQVADAKIEGCTFNHPYTYAVQLDETSNHLVFNNNTINDAQSAIYVHSGTTASSVSQSGNKYNRVIFPLCGRPQALNDSSNEGMEEFWYYVVESADSKNDFKAASNKPGRTVALAGSFTKQINLSSANNRQNIYGPNWNINPTTNEAALKTNWTISSSIKFSYDTGNKPLENITIKGLYIAGGHMNQQYGGLRNVTIENCAFIGNTDSGNGFIAHIGSHAGTTGYVIKNNLFRYTPGSVSARVMLWGTNLTENVDVEFSNNKLDKAYLHIDSKVNAKVKNNTMDVTGLDMIYNVVIANGSENYVSEFVNNTYKGASFCAYYLYSGNFVYGKNIKTSGDNYYGIPNLFGLRGASVTDNSLSFSGHSAATYN